MAPLLVRFTSPFKTNQTAGSWGTGHTKRRRIEILRCHDTKAKYRCRQSHKLAWPLAAVIVYYIAPCMCFASGSWSLKLAVTPPMGRADSSHGMLGV